MGGTLKAAFAVACGGLLLSASVLGPDGIGRVAGGPAHFIFFNVDRERIAEVSFLEHPGITGAQLKYTWRELESERDRYALEPMLADLAFLERHGKALWVQLQDVSFDERVNAPDYLRAPEFGGGVARKYESGADGAAPRFGGWVTRRWDAAVQVRFARLLEAIADAADGRLAGITLPETSIGFGDDATRWPAGYSYAAYVKGITANLTAARRAFRRSTVMQYANFMPGEWLPGDDHGYLRAVYAHAATIGAAVGGPDLMPNRPGQRNHSLALIAARPRGVLAGLAVQDGNLAETDPATGMPVSAEALLAYATGTLRLDYLFWGVEEPYYSRDVLPLLRKR
jgi:hypothetical protein